MKMQKYFFGAFVIGLLILFGCQSAEKNEVEIPVIHENLTLEELKDKVSIPIQLPTQLPFEPVGIVVDLEDYSALYEEETVEMIFYYLKDNQDYRYLELSISNLEQKPSEDEKVTLSDGTNASYAQDEIGQLLFWEENGLYYRLVYYTSTDVNEGQDPLTIDQLIEIADSFQPI